MLALMMVNIDINDNQIFIEFKKFHQFYIFRGGGSFYLVHTFYLYMRNTLLLISAPDRRSISDFSCLSNVDKVSCLRTQPAALTKARTGTLRSKFQGSTD